MAGVEERPFYFGLTFEDSYERDPADIPFKLLVPSLENMASVKLAIGLFIQKWTEKDSRPFHTSVVDRVRNEVLSDISVVKFPTSLKEKLSYDVVRVEKELKSFIGFFRSPEDDDLVSRLDIKNIIWTSRGQIDYIDTTELIRNCEGINQEVRDFDFYHQKYGWDPTVVYGMTNNSPTTSRLHGGMSDEEAADLKSFIAWKKYFIWDQTFGKGLFLTKNKWFNQSHSMIQAYFICTSDQDRYQFINTWLSYMHDTFFLLAKLSKEMLKLVMMRSRYFIDQLLNNSLQVDYFFQSVTLIAAERVEINFINIAIMIVNQRTDLKDWPLACNYYTNFYDKFVEFLSQNVIDDENEMAYCYLLLHRQSMDFVEINSILSGMNRINMQRILMINSSSVCAFVLCKKGLDVLKMLVVHCYETEQNMESLRMLKKMATDLVKRADILFHYYDSNDFDGFISFFNWVNTYITLPNSTCYLQRRLRYRPSVEDLSLTYLCSCIARDRDHFVASCLNGYNLAANDEVYHTSNGVLNWIYSCDQEMVERIKTLYVRQMRNTRCHPGEYGKFYEDFNNRMIPWLCCNYYKDMLQLKNMKFRPINNMNSLIIELL